MTFRAQTSSEYNLLSNSIGAYATKLGPGAMIVTVFGRVSNGLVIFDHIL